MRALAKNATFNIFYKLSSIVFTLITTAYVSRILMPEGVGAVSYAQNVASYFVTLASLGLPAYGVREIAKVRGQKEETSKVYSELILLSFILTLISSLLYVLLIFSFDKYKENIALYLACGLPVFLNFMNVDWLYQAEEEYAYIAIRSIAIKILSLIFVILFVNSITDYLLYAIVVSLASVGNYIFNIFHAGKFVKISFRYIQLRRHLKSVAALGLTLILGAIYNKIDITMLGTMTSENVVGIYSNAHKAIDAILTCCIAVTSTFLPRLSIYAQNDAAKMQSLLNIGYQALTFIIFPAMFGLIAVAPKLIVVMYGADFSPAITTVRIFSVLIIIRTFGDLFAYQLLIALGKEKKRVYTSLAATCVNILLNYFLIPGIEQNGAALASIISELVMNVPLLIYVLRITRRQNIRICWKKPLVYAIATSAITAIAAWLMANLISNVVLGCVFSILSGVVIYFLLNIVFKNDFVIGAIAKIKSIKI